MRRNTSENGFSMPVVIAASVILLLLVLLACYFLFWRASDDNYGTAANFLQPMVTSAKNTSAYALGVPRYVDLLNTSSGSGFINDANSYNQAADQLQDAPALQKDFAAKALYEKDKQAIVDYGTFVQKFATSITSLQMVVSTCGAMVDSIATGNVTAAFYKDANDCRDEINNAKSKGSVFDKQFTDKFLQGQTDKISAYKNWVKVALAHNSSGVKAANAAIRSAQKKVHDALYSKVTYASTPPPAPTDTLQNLLNTIVSHQNSLLR